MSALTPDLARSWLDRWDRQQAGYLPKREERFDTIIDTVAAATDRPDPVVIDLGCGPGSLSVRLLDRLPKATVIAVDTDPLLLALGKAAYGHRDGLRFVDANLTQPQWTDDLQLPRPAEAAVSTTALHWLDGDALRVMYARLAAIMAEGGVFANGDHLYVDEQPQLSQLEQHVVDAAKQRTFGDSPPEDWRQWWEAVAADEILAPLSTRRETAAHDSSAAKQLSTHLDALAEAGFTETGTVWQQGNDRVLCAVR